MSTFRAWLLVAAWSLACSSDPAPPTEGPEADGPRPPKTVQDTHNPLPCRHPDVHEPNQDLRSATALGIDRPDDLWRADDLSLLGGTDDRDLFTLTIPAGCGARATAVATDPGVDLAITMLAGPGQQVASASSTEGAVTASWDDPVGHDLDMTIQIAGAGTLPEACVRYALDIEIPCTADPPPQRAPQCGLDVYEPNGTRPTATDTRLTLVTSSFQAWGVELDNTPGAAPDPVDQYWALVRPDCTVFASMAGPGRPLLDYRMELTDAAGQVLAVPAPDNLPTLMDLQWTNTSTIPQIVYARLWHERQVCIEYNLSMQLWCSQGVVVVPPPGAVCPADAWESNNLQSTAYPTGVEHHAEIFQAAGARVGGFDERDVYALSVPPGCRADAWARFSHVDGDLAMDLSDAHGVLALSDTNTNEERILWTNPTGTRQDA